MGRTLTRKQVERFWTNVAIIAILTMMVVASFTGYTFYSQGPRTNAVEGLGPQIVMLATAEPADIIIVGGVDTEYARVFAAPRSTRERYINISYECGRYTKFIDLESDVVYLRQVKQLVRRASPEYEKVRDEFIKHCFVLRH